MKLCLLLSLAVGAFSASISSKKSAPGDTLQLVRVRRSTDTSTTTSTDACDATKTALTDTENKETVDLHNGYRSKEKAADELKLSFSASLANRAQQLANKCVWEHGLTTDCDGNTIGQNMYMRGGGVEFPKLNNTFYIENWYVEKKDYTAATKICAPGKKCGHYTQVAWAPTGQVGCGYKKCANVTVEGSKPWTNALVFVCDYSPAGNNGGDVNTPGVPCSLCNKVVKNGYQCEKNLCSPCVPKVTPGCTCDPRKCVNGAWSAPDCACKCTEGFAGTLCDKKSGCNDAYVDVCAGWASYCPLPEYKTFMTTTCPKTCKFCTK